MIGERILELPHTLPRVGVDDPPVDERAALARFTDRVQLNLRRSIEHESGALWPVRARASERNHRRSVELGARALQLITRRASHALRTPNGQAKIPRELLRPRAPVPLFVEPRPGAALPSGRKGGVIDLVRSGRETDGTLEAPQIVSSMSCIRLTELPHHGACARVEDPRVALPGRPFSRALGGVRDADRARQPVAVLGVCGGCAHDIDAQGLPAVENDRLAPKVTGREILEIDDGRLRDGAAEGESA